MMLNISAKTGESTANQDQEPKTHQSKNRKPKEKIGNPPKKEGSPEVTKNQRTKTRKRTNRKTENPKKIGNPPKKRGHRKSPKTNEPRPEKRLAPPKIA